MKLPSLRAANTLGLPAVAERAAIIRDEAELAALLRDRPGGEPLLVLGGGSNVVLREHVAGLVCLLRMRGYRESPAADGDVRVTAAAGERWHDLVRRTLGRGLYGLENLALIPGSVGAAPIQNIGAYGVELEERFVALRAMDVHGGGVRTFRRQECGFGYRDSVFKGAQAGRWIVLDVTLRLSRRAAPVLAYPDLQAQLARLGRAGPTPVDVAEAVIRVRRRKLPDPRRVGNAGSFFKNPVVDLATAAALLRRHAAVVTRPAEGGRVKLSAAQLIDLAGWKGRSLGRAGVWHRQPLVLVNRGGATAADILALGDAIRRDVAGRFGIHLELEPQVVGDQD